MTGTSRLLTLTATAVIALAAASGPSLAGQDRGTTYSYGQELAKQIKQAEQNKQAKRNKHAKRAAHGRPGKPVRQAMLNQPPMAPKTGKAWKHKKQAGFVTRPMHGKPPKPVFSPAPVRPVVLPFNPPKHDNRAPRFERPKHAVYAPPRPNVQPDYGHGRDGKHGYRSEKYAGHGGYAPGRPVAAPERHYHNHDQRVVVHEHYREDRSQYHDRDDGSYLLPLVALGVTAAFLASQADYGAPAAYPAYQEEVTFTTPRAPVAQPAVQTAPIETAGPPSTCLMTREYQTQISVGGQLVPGYGQACLQPDGSWYHGPAVPESY
ncbi:MAG: hypothetical protein OEM59_18150 [Rhodospirillales bacterium]|nr:hypothetical protein [Rhodospirillales bacterium]